MPDDSTGNGRHWGIRGDFERDTLDLLQKAAGSTVMFDIATVTEVPYPTLCSILRGHLSRLGRYNKPHQLFRIAKLLVYGNSRPAITSERHFDAWLKLLSLQYVSEKGRAWVKEQVKDGFLARLSHDAEREDDDKAYIRSELQAALEGLQQGRNTHIQLGKQYDEQIERFERLVREME